MDSNTDIQAFSNLVARDFLAFVRDEKHFNRFRMSYERKAKIMSFVLDPNKRYKTPEDKHISQLARGFAMVNGQLYRMPEANDKRSRPRLVGLEDEAFGLIVRTHQRLGHAGYQKTFNEVQHIYYGITRKEVEWVIARCQNCLLNRPSTTRAPLQPIAVEETFERVQVDLIDMRHEPDGQFKWFLHAKDHFSKLSALWPLKSKHADVVAESLAQFIMFYGPPSIIQCNNGKEFKGALLILLRKHGIKCVNGNPRSPQTQGLVEQGNNVVEHKIRAWKMEHQSTHWSHALLEVCHQINSQMHSVTRHTPYEIVFRHRFHTESWVPHNERSRQAIPNEDGTSFSELNIDVVRSLSDSPPQSPVVNTQAAESNPIRGLISDTRNLEDASEEELLAQANGSPDLDYIPLDQYIEDPEEEEILTQENNNIRQHGWASRPQWEVQGVGLPGRQPINHLSSVGSSSALLADVHQRHIRNRQYMSRKYDKKWSPDVFEVGDIVALKLACALRTSTDNIRLFCAVVDRPYRNSYQLRCRHGILTRKFPTKDLERVPEITAASIVIPVISDTITLVQAAELESTSTRVRVACQCDGRCGSLCRCVKEQLRCSLHCHRDEHDCENMDDELTAPYHISSKRQRADTIGNTIVITKHH